MTRALALLDAVPRNYPGQPRDPDGEFASGGGGSAGLTGDAALRAAPLRVTDVKVNEYTGKVTSKPGPGMEADEARALASYRDRGFVKANGSLRKSGGEVPTGATGDMITRIDSAMSRSQLTHDVAVERGIRNGRAAFGDRWDSDLTGTTFVDHGFVSTTTSHATASDFAAHMGTGNEPALVRMSVPKGTSAIQLSGREHESELLLERGLTYEITSDSGPGSNREITMTVRRS